MLLQLNFASETPIYQQIRNQIVLGIASGALEPGEQLPTIRALADQSGINMMTVSKAYQQLRAEGYITGGRRSGAVVSAAPGAGPGKSHREALTLLAAEAKLAGLSAEAFLQLCRQAYETANATPAPTQPANKAQPANTAPPPETKPPQPQQPPPPQRRPGNE